MTDHPALAAAAAFGLPDVRAGAVRIEPADASDVVAAARRDGMAGFLASAARAGIIAADPATTDAAFAAWQRAMTGAVMVEALAVRTARLLDDANVRWRLTKGAAVAHLDYPTQMAQRTFGDMDVVIHPLDWYRSLDALLRDGHRRPSPELRERFDIRFGKGATIVDADELEIDLHLRFAIGRFGVLARSEELFARADAIELAGRTLPTLSGQDRLLHACYHAVLGGFSAFRAARDVAQLLLVSGVDWEATREAAERWGVGAVVAAAIRRCWDTLALDVAHPAHRWACGRTLGRRDARAIEVFATGRPFREQALTAVPALPLRLLPSYLIALGLPSPQARRARARTVRSHVTSSARQLLRRTRRDDPDRPTRTA